MGRDIRQKMAMEALGVFALCYIGGWAVQWALKGSLDLTGVALAHCVVLALFIFIGFEISGSHFNPAVTLALIATGHQDYLEGAFYILAQFGGSFLAGLVLLLSRPSSLETALKEVGHPHQLGHPSLSPDNSQFLGFLCEFLATACLVFTVFSAGVHKQSSAEAVSSSVGLSLGLMILAIGNYTGGALNPCRVFGPALFSGAILQTTQNNAQNNAQNAQNLAFLSFWIYLAGPILGGLCAGLFYEWVFIRNDERIIREQQIKEEEIQSIELQSYY